MKRLVIASLCSNMGSLYHENIITGVEDYCREHGHNHLTFAGGPPGAPDLTIGARADLFKIINPQAIDGFVIPISSLLRYASPERCQAFLDSLAPAHIISIGGAYPGITNVIPEYRRAMIELMEHMILAHGCRQFAIIRGPESHASSAERVQAFREALEKNGLEFRSELVVVADLSRTGGIAAAEKLLNAAGDRLPDAIISVNDQVMVGVMDQLGRKGLRIPQDIKVASTQGIPEGSFTNPPLTVAKENDYLLGYHAAANLTALISGKELPPEIRIPTDLILRQSCGCNPGAQIDTGSAQGSPENIEVPIPEISAELPANSDDSLLYLLKTNAAPMARHLFDVLEASSEGHSAGIGIDLIDNLLISFIESFEDGNPQAFRDELMHLGGLLTGIEGISAMFSTLSSLRALVLGRIKHPQDLMRFETVWSSAQAIMETAREQLINYPNFLTRKHINFIREVNHYLGATLELKGLLKVFNNYGHVNECYVVLYDYGWREQKGVVSERARLLYGYRDRNNVEATGPESPIFATKDLLPEALLSREDRYGFFIEPLNFGTNQIGYILFDFSSRLPTVLETVQGAFSSVLNNTQQIMALHEAEERFSDIAYSTSDWLWETDVEHRYTYCSEGVIKVIGYTAQELIGHTLFDFLQPSEHAYKDNLLNDILPNRKPIQNLESWNIHKNGYAIGLLISGNPIIRGGELVGYRGVFKDITQTKAAEEKVRFLAYYDILTGLPNRTLYHDRLETALQQARREEKLMAIMFLDLDRFKQVNDTLGHAAGDELLQKVAMRLKNCVRTSETLARLGGDEFTILMPEIKGPEESATLGKRILQALGAPMEIKGEEYFVTSSIGISVFPRDGNDSQTLLKHADQAMYKAKESGKNRFVFYDADAESSSTNRLELENIMYQAIEKGWLAVHYQPLVTSSGGVLFGFEALLRLTHPVHGSVPPSVFIPLAEEIGLIESYTEWVLQEACRSLCLWRNEGLTVRTMAVNASRTLFRNNHLYEIVSRTLRDYNIDPFSMELEITENAFIENESNAREILDKLRSLGIGIALDDFGTGYSSLSSLQRFPITTVKIDRSFIADMDSQQALVIVETILFMARKLGMKVIAEGIETKVELERLLNLSCDEFQGFYFGRPAPFNEATEVLRRGYTLPPPPKVP